MEELKKPKSKEQRNLTAYIVNRGFFSWFSGSSETKYENLDKQIEDNQLEVKMLKTAHNELFLGNKFLSKRIF